MHCRKESGQMALFFQAYGNGGLLDTDFTTVQDKAIEKGLSRGLGVAGEIDG